MQLPNWMIQIGEQNNFLHDTTYYIFYMPKLNMRKKRMNKYFLFKQAMMSDTATNSSLPSFDNLSREGLKQD